VGVRHAPWPGAVTDDGAGGRTPEDHSDLFDEHGRGVGLVRAVAARSGYWQDERGRTTVYFEIEF
jgi:hypothetical protein